MYDETDYGGDCCEAALWGAEKLVTIHRMSPDDLRIVHGLVTGAGGVVEGLRYGHAWIELNGTIVFDFSNGNRAVLMKRVYYEAGEVDERETRVYTLDEARRQCVTTGFYGPWDEGLLERWIPEELSCSQLSNGSHGAG
ncbi:hypothetical protein [Thioalkalivibrio sp. ALgr3]|uniref:hypothetical protein n=1 Tax=Thioalkalivibrio sp. ALgr3 TaxID=1239292 RepID=UPI000380F41D|nr:hypothetical protein [Thioalkalivibrio sp. ALgr3]